MDPEASGLTLAEMEPVYTAATDRAKNSRDPGGHSVRPRGLTKCSRDCEASPSGRTNAGRSGRRCAASFGHRSEGAAESELAAARSLGYGEAHPTMVRLQANVVECRRRVQQCVQDLPPRRPNLPLAPSPLELVGAPARLHRQIQASEKEMQQIDARRRSSRPSRRNPRPSLRI